MNIKFIRMYVARQYLNFTPSPALLYDSWREFADFIFEI
jgi:hypothetical protein